MIQRKQSIYLLFATIVMALFYFFPIAEFMVNSTDYYLNFKEIASLNNKNKDILTQVYPLTILLSLIVGLNFIAIFLYKNRSLQMRLITFNIIVTVGFIGLVVFYIYQAANTFETKYYLQYTFILPLIAIIFNFLAYKGIKKDDNIVKSYDRIR